MAKWYGKIGFAIPKEQTTGTGSATRGTGVWVDEITERNYFGDISRHSRSLQNSDSLNDDITISNEISIIADPFATDNVYAMRYIVLSGQKWKVTQANIQYPRLVLTVGGLYNG